jgi:hypothetical protein
MTEYPYSGYLPGLENTNCPLPSNVNIVHLRSRRKICNWDCRKGALHQINEYSRCFRDSFSQAPDLNRRFLQACGPAIGHGPEWVASPGRFARALFLRGRGWRSEKLPPEKAKHFSYGGTLSPHFNHTPACKPFTNSDRPTWRRRTRRSAVRMAWALATELSTSLLMMT